MITKDMIKEYSRANTIRKNLDELLSNHTKEYCLDALTTAFLTKEVDIEAVTKWRYQ